jgi:hypothetical protein
MERTLKVLDIFWRRDAGRGLFSIVNFSFYFCKGESMPLKGCFSIGMAYNYFTSSREESQ